MSVEAVPSGPAPSSRIPSAWTKPLQYSIAGWYLINAIWVLSLPFWLTSTLAVIIYGAIVFDPNPTSVPGDWVQSTTSDARGFLTLWALVFVPIHLTVALGSLKRWTWMHFAAIVLLVIGAAPVPFAAIELVGQPPARSVTIDWIFTVFGLVGFALLVPMVVATFMYGPWATRKVSAVTTTPA